MIDVDGIDFPAPKPPTAGSTPPLFGTLYQGYNENRNGVIGISLPDGSNASITVYRGRVVNVAHPSTAAGAIVDLLRRTGIVAESDLIRAERKARKRGLFLDEALVAIGRISAGTLSNVREMLCRETILELLLDRSISVSPIWSSPAGVRETCTLPIPFILREGQRRSQELPNIRRIINSNSMVFARSAAIGSNLQEERWEDLKVGASERQVYFFVDGRRTVSDLSMATCQSEFTVSRALASLKEAGLVRPISGAPFKAASDRASRNLALRFVSLFAAAAALVAFLSWGIWSSLAGHHPVINPTQNPFRGLETAAAEARIEGASRLYELAYRRPPSSFQDLLAMHLVAPGDARVALVLSIEGSFPAPDPGTFNGGKEPFQEADGEDTPR
jgi:DNA-binding transcriptional ArsR family regulator